MRVKAKNIDSISFRCSKDLHSQAEKLSELTMIPVSIMCRLALTEYIKNHSVGIVMQEPVEPKPTQTLAPAITKPAPPKAQGRPRKPEYTEDDRAYDAWIRANEITVDKPAEYGDDWD